jgi:hypothetical protein
MIANSENAVLLKSIFKLIEKVEDEIQSYFQNGNRPDDNNGPIDMNLMKRKMHENLRSIR